MGKLYDARVKLERAITDKRLEEFRVKGKLGLQSGLLIATIAPTTPDDDAKLARLRAAAREFYDIDL